MNRLLLFILSSVALASAGCAVGGNSTVINPFDWSEPAVAKAPVALPAGQPALAMADR